MLNILINDYSFSFSLSSQHFHDICALRHSHHDGDNIHPYFTSTASVLIVDLYIYSNLAEIENEELLVVLHLEESPYLLIARHTRSHINNSFLEVSLHPLVFVNAQIDDPDEM